MKLFKKNRPKKDTVPVNVVELPFSRLSIEVWNSKYELRIKYVANLDGIEYRKEVEKTFNNIEDALKYAVDTFNTSVDIEATSNNK
jgi:hypothetical protein